MKLSASKLHHKLHGLPMFGRKVISPEFGRKIISDDNHPINKILYDINLHLANQVGAPIALELMRSKNRIE